jgi:hypothetical protein
VSLESTDGTPFDRFGIAVGISGNRVVVGSDADQAFLYERTNGNLLNALLGTGSNGGEDFRASVDIGSGFVVVGAPRDNGILTGVGSAFLFDSITGSQIRKLVAGDGALGDEFGRAVAVSDMRVLVGTPSSAAGADNTGSAYLFGASSGALVQKLVAPVTASWSEFGASVAIIDSVAIVGSRKRSDYNGYRCGATFLFDCNTGLQVGKVLPADGMAEDQFVRRWPSTDRPSSWEPSEPRGIQPRAVLVMSLI